jgi:hypothetical protein
MPKTKKRPKNAPSDTPEVEIENAILGLFVALKKRPCTFQKKCDSLSVLPSGSGIF